MSLNNSSHNSKSSSVLRTLLISLEQPASKWIVKVRPIHQRFRIPVHLLCRTSYADGAACNNVDSRKTRMAASTSSPLVRPLHKSGGRRILLGVRCFVEIKRSIHVSQKCE